MYVLDIKVNNVGANMQNFLHLRKNEEIMRETKKEGN